MTKLKSTFIYTFILLFINISASAQTNITGTSYLHFQLKFKKDTIDFVVADTNINIRKPVLLFCQGSQPVPLFIDLEENGLFPGVLSNFDIGKLNEQYHVVIISMPKTPLIVGLENLNKQDSYITDSSNQHSYSKEYLQADYSENYVQRANEVLKYLVKQKWVEPNRVVVAGHSQGARIAVGIASTNKKVSHLGLFAYNPNGRIDQSIRRARKMAEAGKISWEEADSLQQEQYAFYETIQNEDTVESHPSLISWKSFSKPTIEQLIQLKIPVYIAYGSEDIVADFCDLLPLYFIEAEKKNYIVKRYPNLEHNFFPVNEKSEIDYINGKWQLIIDAFTNWIDDPQSL